MTDAICPTSGKRQMTYEVAQHAAKRQRRAHDHRVAAYHCGCGWWHVGSQKQPKGVRKPGAKSGVRRFRK